MQRPQLLNSLPPFNRSPSIVSSEGVWLTAWHISFQCAIFFKLKTAVLGISCCNFDPSLDKLILQTNPFVDVTTLSLWGHLGDHLYVYLWCEHVQMFSFWDRVLLYSLGWPQTCNLTAWACWAVGLQMEAIAPILSVLFPLPLCSAETELRTSHRLGKCSTVEQHSQPLPYTFIFTFLLNIL